MPRWKGSSNVSSSLWYFDICWYILIVPKWRSLSAAKCDTRIQMIQPKKTCETTAVPQASDWNPMIKIIENSVSGAICTVWSCILTAIARPQAPLSHPARARGRVFTAGLIPITLYRFVFADFLLLSKSCHHVSAPSLHSVLKGQSHCWALNWARKTATCELSKRNMSWPWGPGY